MRSTSDQPSVLGGPPGRAARVLALSAPLLIGSVLAVAATPAAPLAWTDTAGRAYGPTEYREAAATALVFGSVTCPCADRYNGRVAALEKDFGRRGVRFFMVFSDPATTPEAVRRYVSARKLTLPVVHDQTGALARRLGATATPAAVVLDRGGRIRYRGRVDDNPDPQAVAREDLREALEDVLDGQEVRLASTRTSGCSLQPGVKPPDPPPYFRKLAEDIGTETFRITTGVPAAQRLFDHGLNRWFGFNFPEAEADFQEAARVDPRCAMAQWGIALSLGMTYNFDFNPKRLPEATRAMQRAKRLARHATPRERALIDALAIRHAPGTDMAKQLQPYRAAMGRVHRAYPEDVNLAVLYAASTMDLRPWHLWSPDGKPAPGTLETVRVLENALKRDPNHIGANHYYIHATEASPHPQKALPSVGRLAAQAPRSGHLVHMPSHTLFRLGAYRASTSANQRASALDFEYFTEKGKPTQYGGYYIHNLDFIVACEMYEGRKAAAIAAARDLGQAAGRWAPDFAPIFCGGSSGIMAVYSRFGMWDEILKAPAAVENPVAQYLWRYARGMARIGTGELAEAEKEQAAMAGLMPALRKLAAAIAVPGQTEGLLPTAETMRHHLAGKLAAAKGDLDAAERAYRQGIRSEDSIPYSEPPPWRHPVRESLGALLLTRDRAPEAEGLFRAELKAHPKSGRALYGLWQSLEKQGKTDEAARVKAQFEEAWTRADTSLTLQDL